MAGVGCLEGVTADFAVRPVPPRVGRQIAKDAGASARRWSTPHEFAGRVQPWIYRVTPPGYDVDHKVWGMVLIAVLSFAPWRALTRHYALAPTPAAPTSIRS